MARQKIKKLGPLSRATGVRQIATNQNEVQGVDRMQGFNTSQDTIETFVSLWTGTSAFDAEAVSLANDVNVGKMGYAPPTTAQRTRTKSANISRLIHRRVSKTPNERGRREID